MKTIRAIDAMEDLDNLIAEAVEIGQPIRITSERGDAVLVSVDDWNAIQETLYLVAYWA